MSMHALENRSFSAAELLRMSRGSSRRFLVRGRLIEQPYRTPLAGSAGAAVCASLGKHVKAHGLGVVFASGTGFQIGSSPDTVLAPAVAFVRMDPAELGDGYHAGAPDVVVEVLSALDDPEFVPAVVDEWLKAGCRFVVVVDPSEETVTVYRPPADVLYVRGDGVLDGGEVVPGWTLPLRELFG